MRTYHTPLDLVRSRHLENPVVCKRPDLLSRASRWFQENFPGDVLYAVKANPSDWVIDGLYAAGTDFYEVASLSEIELIAQRLPQARMAYLHPVKSRLSIRKAYFDYGVRIFAIDCEAELAKILEETGNARDLTLMVRLAVSSEHALFSLAGKFGITADAAPQLIKLARAHARELGVSFHIGSQCMEPVAYSGAMQAASRLIAAAGVTVDIVDVGGGFPCIYPGMTPPPMQDFVDAIETAFEPMLVHDNAKLWCEPGRALVAEAESVVARIDLRKDNTLYINEGSYGALFDAVHASWRFPIRALRQNPADLTGLAEFSLFGPTCDSIDAMPGPYALPADIAEGDYVEIGMLGAYGTSLATGFNGFGQYDYVTVEDQPFASMFDTSTSAPAASGAFIDEEFAR